MTPQPFLKWAGGKRKLVPDLMRHVPETYGTYYEPFIGGGALFFHLRPKCAVIADANVRLIRAYRGVRYDVDAVLRRLGELMPSDRAVTREEYDAVRDRQNDLKDDVEVAAWFIFMNKHGYNGVYRENKSGGYNVPWNKSTSRVTIDADNLRACSEALQNAALIHDDFAHAVADASRGDVVYFDPPYIPISVTSSFTVYTSKGFTMDDQRRLRDTARELAGRGVNVILSNSRAPAVSELYAGDDFRVTSVKGARAINCDGLGRGAVTERIIIARRKDK